MLQHLISCQSFRWVNSHQAANQTLGLRRDRIRDRELPATDLPEQHRRVFIVERVTANQHGIEDDPKAPNVRAFARVASGGGVEDLWRDVGGAAVFVAERVVAVPQDGGILKALQYNMGSAN